MRLALSRFRYNPKTYGDLGLSASGTPADTLNQCDCLIGFLMANFNFRYEWFLFDLKQRSNRVEMLSEEVVKR